MTPHRRFTDAPAIRQRSLVAACILAAIVGTGVRGAEPSGSTSSKPDFVALDALLQAGRYAELVAATDGIAEAAPPEARDDDYLRRSVDVIQALMRRGFAELRLGRVAAASATLDRVTDTFRDREFQRLLNLASRGGGAKAAAGLVELELTRLDLLYARMKVLVASLEDEASRNAEADDAASADTAALRDRVAGCLVDLDSLRKQAADARESFIKRFGNASAGAEASPFARALVGPFWSALIDGRAAFEQSRLPLAALPVKSTRGGSAAGGSADGSADDPRVDLRAIAIEHFAKAAEAIDAIVAAVKPKTGDVKPVARIELSLLEIEVRVARARAWIEAGDMDHAREDIDRIMELRRVIGGLRKDPKPEAHPDQFVPLLLDAEVRLAEAGDLLAAGKADAAWDSMVRTQQVLDLAASLSVPDDHPSRGRLAAIRSSLDECRARIERVVPQSDAVDAAARRLIRGIEDAAVPEVKAGEAVGPTAGSSP